MWFWNLEKFLLCVWELGKISHLFWDKLKVTGTSINLIGQKKEMQNSTQGIQEAEGGLISPATFLCQQFFHQAKHQTSLWKYRESVE